MGNIESSPFVYEGGAVGVVFPLFFHGDRIVGVGSRPACIKNDAPCDKKIVRIGSVEVFQLLPGGAVYKTLPVKDLIRGKNNTRTAGIGFPQDISRILVEVGGVTVPSVIADKELVPALDYIVAPYIGVLPDRVPRFYIDAGRPLVGGIGGKDIPAVGGELAALLIVSPEYPPGFWFVAVGSVVTGPEKSCFGPEEAIRPVILVEHCHCRADAKIHLFLLPFVYDGKRGIVDSDTPYIFG